MPHAIIMTLYILLYITTHYLTLYEHIVDITLLDITLLYYIIAILLFYYYAIIIATLFILLTLHIIIIDIIIIPLRHAIHYYAIMRCQILDAMPLMLI